MRVAAGDVGTNSTRLLIAEVDGGRVVPRERLVVVTGLGAGVDRSGFLGEAGMARTLEVLAGYRAAAAAAGVAAVRVVATAAVRAATGNRAEFLDRAEAALGVRPDVIGGHEEAELSFEGATRGLARPGPYLVIDVGGGSTEFVFGTAVPESVASADLGSRRVTERFLPSASAGPGEVAAAAEAVARAFAAVDLAGAPATVVGVGGTFTALAAIALGLEEYDPQQVHGSVLSRSALEHLVGRLAGMTPEAIAFLPSLDPARAPVLLGGAIVAEEALARSGGTEVVVSEADLLDAVARRLAGV